MGVSMRCRAMMVVAVFVSLASGASAGDEKTAREYIKVSGFRENLTKTVKSMGIPAGQVSAIDLDVVEANYAKSIARYLSNEEIKALIQAQSIPGYRSAMGKMTQVSTEMMATAYKASQDAANKLGVKSDPPPPKRP